MKFCLFQSSMTPISLAPHSRLTFASLSPHFRLTFALSSPDGFTAHACPATPSRLLALKLRSSYQLISQTDTY